MSQKPNTLVSLVRGYSFHRIHRVKPRDENCCSETLFYIFQFCTLWWTAGGDGRQHVGCNCGEGTQSGANPQADVVRCRCHELFVLEDLDLLLWIACYMPNSLVSKQAICPYVCRHCVFHSGSCDIILCRCCSSSLCTIYRVSLFCFAIERTNAFSLFLRSILRTFSTNRLRNLLRIFKS